MVLDRRNIYLIDCIGYMRQNARRRKTFGHIGGIPQTLPTFQLIQTLHIISIVALYIDNVTVQNFVEGIQYFRRWLCIRYRWIGCNRVVATVLGRWYRAGYLV